jgi:hypothetical protein
MANADFVLTSGVLGAASLRVGARQLLPRAPRWTLKVSDDEAASFVASLSPAPHEPRRADAAPANEPAGSSERRTPVSASR